MTTSICYLTTTVVVVIQALVFPPTHVKIHYWSWFIIFVCELVCFVALYLYLPETKNTQVGDIVSKWITPKSRRNTRIGTSRRPSMNVSRLNSVASEHTSLLHR